MKALLLVFLLGALSCLLIVAYKQTVPPARASVISTDYLGDKAKFKELSESRGGVWTSYAISASGPNGEPLTVDFIRFGDVNPRHVFLHIAGTHGVEGYAGTAIQNAVVRDGLVKPPAGTAVVLINGLNPWGMINKRRFNESNVDLNRNMYLEDGQYVGAPDGYRKIESFINRPGAPSRVDSFFLEVVWNVVRHGFTALKQAIAGGQYEYPNGLYYGGSHLEESHVILKRHFEEFFKQIESMYVIEVHTGLGVWGKDLLFWPLHPSHPESQCFSKALDEQLDSDAPDEGAGFKTPGDLQNELPKLIPQARVRWVLQEFGAYGPVRTLRALRDENRYYQSGGKELSHWSKDMLVEAFCPGSEEWQKTVVDRGVQLFQKMQRLLDADYAPRCPVSE